MTLAIFDLDHTLIDGDSDYLWGEFMVESGIVDAAAYRTRNLQFYEDYQRGSLDNDQYLAFSLEPLTRHPLEKLHAWRRDFVENRIKPLVKPGAAAKFELHQQQGHKLMIISATHRFITEPIAEMLQIPCLLATEPEIADGYYTGRYLGTATYREGKVVALQQWLKENEETIDGAYFYSDSINDLPLLEQVENPIAVSPDDDLRAIAESRHWPIIEL